MSLLNVTLLILSVVLFTHSFTVTYKIYFLKDLYVDKIEDIIESRGMKNDISIESLMYILKGVYTFLLFGSLIWFGISFLLVTSAI